VDLRTVSHLWRFWYQWVISAPLAGRLVMQSVPAFARAASSFWTVNKAAWSDADRTLFLDQFRERERAEATVRLYRSIPGRESLPAIRGATRRDHLTVPTLFLHGAGDGAIHPALLRGFEEHVDDMHLELIDGCGHFLPEECPDLVLARALDFLA
jgi:pimeloyl-ACP methyl ester carboxylesterase